MPGIASLLAGYSADRWLRAEAEDVPHACDSRQGGDNLVSLLHRQACAAPADDCAGYARARAPHRPDVHA